MLKRYHHFFLCILLCLLPSSAFSKTHVHEALNGFDTLLANHVKDGWVDYSGIAKEKSFATYVAYLAQANVTAMDRNEKLAFYINAYNAFSIKGILDGYSPKSLWGRIRFFRQNTYQVANKKMTLHALENKVIRAFGEPRIHFALVCASASCPILQSYAYRGSKLDQQLDESARGFINNSKKNGFDEIKKEAYLSKIFDWFSEDFINEELTLKAYISQYIKDPELAKSLENERYKIRYKKYDWQLNGKK